MTAYVTSRRGSAAPDTPSVEALVREIRALRRQGANRTAQLGSSSIDDAALALVTGGDVSGYVGTQFDGYTGAVVVSGPKPPVPTMPELATVAGGVRVRVLGTLVDPQPGYISPVTIPTTFRAWEIHVSDSPSFDTSSFDTMRGSIISARGGDFTVPWPTAGVKLYARVVCRTESGTVSDPSLTAGPVLSGAQVRYGSGTTIYYGSASPTPPGGGFVEGDLWLHDLGVSNGAAGHPPAGTPESEVLRWDDAANEWDPTDLDIGASLGTAIATVLAVNSKARIFTEASEPDWTGAAGTAFWIDTAHDNRANVWNGADFVLYQLGNGAIAPASLIASDVIATGTVSADLLAAVLVIAGRLIAGRNATDDRAELDDDGLHVWRTLEGEGVVEVARFGVGTGGGVMGLVDTAGKMVAEISDLGAGSFSTVIADALLVGGDNYRNTISGLSTGVVGQISVYTASNIYPIADIYGLVEVGCVLEAGRAYLIGWMLTYDTAISGAEVKFRVGHSNGVSGNTATQPSKPLATSVLSTPDATWVHSDASGANVWHTEQGSFVFTPSITTRYRFLLTAELDGGSVSNDVGIINNAADAPIQLYVVDLGPKAPVSGGYQAGGASLMTGTVGTSPPSVSQQYDTGFMAPAGYASYRGNGTLRTDTTDVVQGWDPGGYNGDGHGYWWWNLPSITGTVDLVQLYVYVWHTYYNAGGTAIWNMIPSGGGPGFESTKITGDWYVGGYPKVGGVTVTLPSGWWPYFRNASSPRAIGISAGDSGGTNETYYCRFDGPGARLRILYTQ